METWLSLIGEYGFPVVVTFYLLYRIEKKLDTLNQSVQYLSKLVQLGIQDSFMQAHQVNRLEWLSPLQEGGGEEGIDVKDSNSSS